MSWRRCRYSPSTPQPRVPKYREVLRILDEDADPGGSVELGRPGLRVEHSRNCQCGDSDRDESHGLTPNKANQRCTVLLEMPSIRPRVRVLQCVAASGVCCSARLITAATLSSS